ncbi:Heat shock protein 70kD, peptide-binding domain,Heat shock protein 70 family,Heat shock protein [Cinara cedri]|uniref:Heat shock protein 70kD, peptide-binding domain,Heat shock protein 70 family,Heat shock protein n=1 Tax=Cinara cedri TaxID=506608 RepID=A0A5E4MQ86_9HEMI|nr:Heat shock protein 70kD, peptide-binding domain,Heat shock protein 70 family,Heat shock protein [Cinara cedri]
MAAMSVIGIDFGSESCYVAVARAGGIETIANDYSLRATPSCVAFSPRNRIIGVAAKNQMVTNMKNTIHGFKRLLGRSIDDPFVKQELRHLPFNVVKSDNNKIGINVNYLNEQHTFSVEQITGMLLTKLKEISEISLKTKVNDCVISVPSYFTNAERKALLDAASIAGLNVLRLFNETAATALSYGIYKQDLPNPEEKPRNVVFVDCGYTSLQVFACAFNKGKLKMLASTFDSQLGGREFDYILAEHFSKDFKSRYNIDPMNNPRAFLRLLAEVEKIKKQMSANSTKLPMNIECFMDDKDVHADIKRTEFEELSMHLFNRVEVTLEQCLKDSKLSKDDIYAVEIVGGSSRIPYIKNLIEKIFGKISSTTLNQDEAVSRGCALQCAMLSPAVRVRDFSVTDIQSFPIELFWDPADNSDDGRAEVFPKNHAVPFSKMLSFYRMAPFTVKAHYSGSIPYADNYIGQFTVRDVKPTADGASQKVKVKARVNLHGIFSISSATLLEKAELQDEPVPPSEPMETSEKELQPTEVEEKKEEKKKSITKTIDLRIESITHGYSTMDLNNYIEQEGKMVAADRQEKERIDVRNSLEEYIYDMRSRISSEDDLAPYIVDADRENISKQLEDLEIWLYEDGEDCIKNIYNEKLDMLKTVGEPIKRRKIEYTTFPSIQTQVVQLISNAENNIDLFHKGNEQFNHLDSAEVDKLAETLKNAKSWLEEKASQVTATPLYKDIPIKLDEFIKEKHNIEENVLKVLYKPKPAPKVEPPPKEPSKEEEKSPTEPMETEQPVENGKDA